MPGQIPLTRGPTLQRSILPIEQQAILSDALPILRSAEVPSMLTADECLNPGWRGFGGFDKAVLTNAAYSILHDHVEDSIIVAPRVSHDHLEEVHDRATLLSLT